MSNGVYDKEDTVSDEDLRNITGIDKSQEKSMERRASRGNAQEILARERAAATQRTVSTTGEGGKLAPNDITAKEDQVGKGYTGGKRTRRNLKDENPEFSDEEIAARKKKLLDRVKIKGNWTRKQKGALFGALGGGGLIGGLGLFGVTMGPLQFIHLSNMLLDHDFSSMDDANDDKANRLLRYAYYAKQGRPERTRLSLLGNKYADRMEARLNSVGFKTAYTKVFGFKQALLIDRRYPQYRDLNDQQFAAKIKEDFGVEPIRARELDGSIPALRDSNLFAINTEALTYRQNKTLTKGLLQKAGLRRFTSALGTNFLKRRAGITLHPIKALDKKVLRNLEKAFQDWRAKRAERLQRGAYNAAKAEAGNKENTPPEQQQAANEQAREGNSTAQQAADANKDIKAGKPGALTKFSEVVNNKWAAGGVIAATVPCILRGMADDAAEIKHSQVIKPAIVLGMSEAVAPGQQAMSGHDITSEQLGFQDRIANAKDANGKPSSWYDARVIQVINGADPAKKPGVAPSKTLANIGAGTPFDFLNQGAVGASLDVVCSTAVQAGILLVTFIGGPVSAAVGLLAAPFVAALLHEGAAWMAGDPLDVVGAVGSAWANIAGFGSRLASDQQELVSGGTVISKATEKNLDTSTHFGLEEEFRSKSLAYRLFNPRDYRTPVARFVDSQNIASPTTNIAKMTNNFLNVGGSFGSLAFGMLSGHSSAASGDGYYEYGFPGVAIDPNVYMKTKYANPYQTGDDAADILDGPDGQKYIDRAKTCNGITIKKDDQGLWTVVSEIDDIPMMKDYTKPECSANGSVTVNNIKPQSLATATSDYGLVGAIASLSNNFGNGFFGLFSRHAEAQSDPTPQVLQAASDTDWETITQYINSSVNMNGLACTFGEDKGCTDVGFDAGAAAGSTTTPVGDLGDARSIAQLMLKNPNITFQTAAGRQAFQEVADQGIQHACGLTISISPVLLGIIQYLSDPARGASAYQIRLGVFATGHPCDGGQHPKGTAVDINGVGRGGVMSPNNQLHFDALNAAQMQVVRQFYQDFANAFPERTGGMGQKQCFPGGPPPPRAGVVYFNDACNHLHVDARKN